MQTEELAIFFYTVLGVSYSKYLLFVAQLVSTKGHGQTECEDKHRNRHSGNNRHAQVMQFKRQLHGTLRTEKNCGAVQASWTLQYDLYMTIVNINNTLSDKLTLTILTDLPGLLAKYPTTIN